MGTYLQQSPVLADEPLWVVLAGLHGRFDQRGEGLGERCLLLQGEVLLLVFALAADLQHAGLLEERARRDDRFAVALFLLSGCCWVTKAKQGGIKKGRWEGGQTETSINKRT